MRSFINKYTTAITAALFLVVAGSGVAMFFHVGKDLVSEMHEWLAVMLVLAAGLHIYKNWPAMMTYIRRKSIYVPLAMTLVAAAAFIVPATLSERASPVHAVMQAMQNAKLTDVGKVFDVVPSELEATLKKQGFVIETSDARLSEIAQASGKPAMAVLMTVVDAARK